MFLSYKSIVPITSRGRIWLASSLWTHEHSAAPSDHNLEVGYVAITFLAGHSIACSRSLPPSVMFPINERSTFPAFTHFSCFDSAFNFAIAGTQKAEKAEGSSE